MTQNRKQITVNVRPRAKPRRRQKNLAGNTGPTAIGQALRALGGAGGSALSTYFGGNPLMGATAGSGLGAALSRWLGQGDYTLRSNTIVNQSLNSTDGIPSMHKSGQSIIVRHKEYVTEVRGNPNFTVRNTFGINPGLKETFPWLSRIASNFQEYRIKGMVYHYIPSSGNAIASTNAALGTVMMQTNYRASDAAPSSKVELLNEYWATESVPSEGFCHPIECDPQENPFKIQYVRAGSIPSGDNVLLYDLGTTNLCVSGQQATDTVLGDLWVTYEVELRKPVVKSNTQDAILGFSRSANIYNTANPLGNSGVVQTGSLGFDATSTAITIPAYAVGDFLITVSWPFSSMTTWTAVAAPTLVGCTLISYQPTGVVVANSTPTLTMTSGPMTTFYTFAIRKESPSNLATITFPAIAYTGATALGFSLLVAQIE